LIPNSGKKNDPCRVLKMAIKGIALCAVISALLTLAGVVSFLATTTDVAEEMGFWWMVGSLAFIIGGVPLLVYLGYRNRRILLAVWERTKFSTLWKIVTLATLIISLLMASIVWRASSEGSQPIWWLVPAIGGIPIVIGVLISLIRIFKSYRKEKFDARRPKLVIQNTFCASEKKQLERGPNIEIKVEGPVVQAAMA
jgi:hypothetical protein